MPNEEPFLRIKISKELCFGGQLVPPNPEPGNLHRVGSARFLSGGDGLPSASFGRQELRAQGLGLCAQSSRFEEFGDWSSSVSWQIQVMHFCLVSGVYLDPPDLTS